MKKIFVLVLVSVMLFGCGKNEREIDKKVNEQEKLVDQVVDSEISFDKEAMTAVLQAIVGEYESVLPTNEGNFVIVSQDSLSFGKRVEENIAKDFEIVDYYTQEAFRDELEDHIFEVSFYDNINEKQSNVTLTITLSEENDFDDEGYNQDIMITFSKNDFNINYITGEFRYDVYTNVKYLN